VPVEDAILAVEIISPESHFRDLYARSKVYAAAGIAHYWVIDPLYKEGITLTRYQPGPSGEYETVGSTRGVFETDVPFPVTLDLPALTARRRALLERSRERE
jgi:Uma2 family endonuclease